MLLRILLPFLLLQSFILVAQPKLKKRAITEIKLNYDSLRANQFYSSIPIGFQVKRNNGRIGATEGYNQGNIFWSRFNINVQNGIFKNGMIYFNWKNVYQNGHYITIQVSPKNNPQLKSEFKIQIPYLTSFQFIVDSTKTLLPGHELPFDLKGYYSNGCVYSAKNNNNGRFINLKDFNIFWNDFYFFDGKISLPTSMDPYPGNINVKGIYKIDSLVTAEQSIPVAYQGHYEFDFRGENGRDGQSGQDATGYNKRNGRDGQNGQDGQRGAKGQTVKMYVKPLVHLSDTLLQIFAVSAEYNQELVLHPQGKLVINCQGGEGGKGGDGGRGSDAMNETDTEQAGYGGDGGSGGTGGDGGEGGKVIIYADAVMLPKINKILVVHNEGGKGGSAGNGGRKGRGGIRKNSEGSFWKALGDLVGVQSGSYGHSGYKGQNGEDGPEYEIHLVNNKDK